jgi:hypothetical protein
VLTHKEGLSLRQARSLGVIKLMRQYSRTICDRMSQRTAVREASRSHAFDSPLSSEGRVGRIRRTPLQGCKGRTVAEQDCAATRPNSWTRRRRLECRTMDRTPATPFIDGSSRARAALAAHMRSQLFGLYAAKQSPT